MNRKLIAIDLDGTTLNNQARLSQKTIDTIGRASKAGHIVSIVTGRPNRISQSIYDQLHLETPMINFNGGLGHLPHRYWSKEYQHTFSRDIVFEILRNRSSLGVEMIAAEGKNLFLAQQDHPVAVGFFPTNLKSTEILNTRTLTTNPTSLTIAVRQDRQRALIQYINDQFGEFVDVAPWGGPNSVVEIGVKGIQKAVGVDFLAHHYSIERENVLAFGDEHNDNEMIEYAGWGVAMANATDHLKGLANDVTPETNDEDGLADYLTTYLKLAE
ncbi:Cof-type HAD-IIB family hydrolase [Secundilactobacillus kimchicus]|uniref:Cof-type HAD-IIB family hydrolase n=1 Tax=Secundilactobacillus kimchicus TaxID=528209 RepID=UPI0024A949E7|nr:Cof-type HAD-IIB family hydrolase [Secundilactobacillus kimchicus]